MFFDPSLSSTGRVSCATCHDPAKGYSSGGLPPKLSGGTLLLRAPSLFNRGAGRAFFWDGRAKSLEEQAAGPLGHPDEMGGPLAAAVQRAAAKYPQVKSARDLTAALAAYERTLASPRTAWDEYREGRNRLALSDAEARGWDLFRGPARCYQCHTGPNLTDDKLHDTGLGGRFKTPGLRGVGTFGGWGHDARFGSLRQVIDHYRRGGGEARRLDLSDREAADLEAFLRSL